MYGEHKGNVVGQHFWRVGLTFLRWGGKRPWSSNTSGRKTNDLIKSTLNRRSTAAASLRHSRVETAFKSFPELCEVGP